MAGTVSWGVISPAKIGGEKVIPAMQKGAVSRIDAIASRDLSRAKETAANLGIGVAHAAGGHGHRIPAGLDNIRG